MSTYLIAGGAGFIGSHLSEALLALGNKVICLDNLITGDEGNIRHLLTNENFTFINHNIIEGVPNISGGIDVIYHFASPASPNAKSSKSYIAFPIQTLMVNSIGTKNLLDLAIQKNARFVYASSSEVYGDPEVSPQKEDYNGNVNPNGPRSVYDEGKRFGEAATFAYIRKFNLKATVLRIFNTYGPRMREDDGRVVSNFIVQCLRGEDITVYGDGEQTRSFCFVDDLVVGIIAAGEKEEANGQVINIGNPEEYKIGEFAIKVKEWTGSDSKIVHEALPKDDPKKRRPDITRARELLGFDPKMSVEEGVKKTISYFREKIKNL